MIKIYSKPNCPYCVNAKIWLEKNGFQYEMINVMEDANALAFIKARGHQTVPQLYKGDDLLVEGGYTGLTKLGVQGLKQRLEG